MGRLKIISDGTVSGTIIVDEETGKQIVNVQRVKWSFDERDNTIFLSIFAKDVPLEMNVETQTSIQAVLPPENVRTATPIVDEGVTSG